MSLKRESELNEIGTLMFTTMFLGTAVQLCYRTNHYDVSTPMQAERMDVIEFRLQDTFLNASCYNRSSIISCRKETNEESLRTEEIFHK